jgi:hypothetical protein
VKRLVSLLLASSLTALTFAQETAPPADPDTRPLPDFNQAMVRFVHAAPNAEIEQAVLRYTGEPVGEEQIIALEYGDRTDYVPMFEGSYEVVVDLEPGAETDWRSLPETIDLVRGRHHTVVLTGLVTEEGTRPADDDGGFFDWLQGLFTEDRPDLALQALVLDDISSAGVAPREADVRVVHAAPGTDTIELVRILDSTVDVLATVGYRDVSDFSEVAGEAGTLELRIAGSDLTIGDLADAELSPGMLHTVILIGTPVEGTPLETIVLSNEWIDPLLVAPAAPGAVGRGPMTADEVTWISDLLLGAEERLAAAEERLAEAASDPSEELVGSARQDVAEARDLLDQARRELDAAVRRGATYPGGFPPATTDPDAPAAEGTEPLEPEPADPAD